MTSYTPQSANTTSYSEPSRNATSHSNISRNATNSTNISRNATSHSNVALSSQDISLVGGAPIGLLLALTYASNQTVSGISWSNQSVN